jgi:dienelactone hydrolase
MNARIIKFLIAFCLMSFIAFSKPNASIKYETVFYKQDTTNLEGLLVYNSTIKGHRPGILLAPDWMGISENAKLQAEKTAKLGYVVFIADIYGIGIRPKDAKEAGTQASIYKADRTLMRARANAALEQLVKSNKVDTTKIAAIGYCFGGGVVLELARSGANLDGIIVFHGSLDTPHPEDARRIRAKVLVLHGADDPYVPAKDVQAFTEEMKRGGVDWILTQYGSAVHAFTNQSAGNDPSKGAAYNENADRRSWESALAFLRETAPLHTK